MKKDLYLLRHGQTLFNSKHLISGWSDSPLTEKGIEQARRAGLFFQKAMSQQLVDIYALSWVQGNCDTGYQF